MSDGPIVVLVEEKSSAIIVEALARQLGIHRRVRVLRHDGIGDLKKSIPRKLRAEPDTATRFLILCDADAENCVARKTQLVALIPPELRPLTKVRIACRELEAWYLAQPDAIRRAGLLRSSMSQTLLNRDPDQITDPKELFLRISHRRGQVDIARKMSLVLEASDSKSRSFFHFVRSLRLQAAD